jgi:hypothetical protein
VALRLLEAGVAVMGVLIPEVELELYERELEFEKIFQFSLVMEFQQIPIGFGFQI